MKKRIEIKRVYKSNEPDKLEVYRARSLDDEIRFYFNEYQYVAAKDEHNGMMFVYFDEEEKQERINQESLLKNPTEKYKEFLLYLLIITCSFILTSIIASLLYLTTKCIASSLLIMNFTYPIGLIGCTLVTVKRDCPQSAKSKHSAQHMMINFLNKNLRLPKNIDDVKYMSRFRKACGSRDLSYDLTEDIKPCINMECALIILIPFEVLLRLKYDNTSLIAIIITIFILYYIFYKIEKCGKLDALTNKIVMGLNFLIQCCNTTKKVEDVDILLAYYAAKCWIQIVYPEYYTEDDGEFEREYLD